jgi:hypothetical protein
MGVSIIIVLPPNTLHCLYKNVTCFGPSDGTSSGIKKYVFKKEAIALCMTVEYF